MQTLSFVAIAAVVALLLLPSEPLAQAQDNWWCRVGNNDKVFDLLAVNEIQVVAGVASVIFSRGAALVLTTAETTEFLQFVLLLERTCEVLALAVVGSASRTDHFFARGGP